MKIKRSFIAAFLCFAVSGLLCSCGTIVKQAAKSSGDESLYTQTGEINKAGNPEIRSEEAVSQETTAEMTAEPITEPPTEPFSMNVSVPEVYELPSSCVIEGFNAVLQEPELPSGCEVTSLTETLNFLGFNIDKITLADEFMPIDLQGLTIMDEAFIGDPYYDGFGCNANVIVQTADKYFASVDSPCYGTDLTGCSLNDVFWQITQGRPVLTWVTIDLHESYPEFVWEAGNGKDFYFDWYQHCMTVYGFDTAQGIVYAADPLKGNVTYPIEQFEKMYNIMGNQAVMICGDSKTEGHHVTTEAERSITMHTRREYEAEKEAAEKKA